MHSPRIIPLRGLPSDHPTAWTTLGSSHCMDYPRIIPLHAPIACMRARTWDARIRACGHAGKWARGVYSTWFWEARAPLIATNQRRNARGRHAQHSRCPPLP
eukprot:8249962-Pyramimonas_sp.AAC.1